MTSHELYDKILRELPKDGFHQKYNGEDLIGLRYLQHKGLIDVQDKEAGLIYSYGLTPEGMVLISEGGFLELDRIKSQSETDAELQRINWQETTKSSRQAKIFSIISIIIAAGAVAISIFKD
ncbi:MAG: hypothetical protein EOO20_01670 [Chryseobacterium sp.]|nr:MAG: hypothetical protein EOO20_01670 [Chryseobacterium sp.]